MTVSFLVTFPDLPYPILVVGDFNIHHPLPDPPHSHSVEELATSFLSLSMSSELGFGLLDQPGLYTHFTLGGSARLTVLDLFFTSPSSLPFCPACDTPLTSTG